MSRSPLPFKQADVTRAVRAVTAAGVEIREVVIDSTGAIRIIAGKPVNSPTGLNPLDKWMADHAGET
jgi:hypothetical protein